MEFWSEILYVIQIWNLNILMEYKRLYKNKIFPQNDYMYFFFSVWFMSWDVTIDFLNSVQVGITGINRANASNSNRDERTQAFSVKKTQTTLLRISKQCCWFFSFQFHLLSFTLFIYITQENKRLIWEKSVQALKSIHWDEKLCSKHVG